MLDRVRTYQVPPLFKCVSAYGVENSGYFRSRKLPHSQTTFYDNGMYSDRAVFCSSEMFLDCIAGEVGFGMPALTPWSTRAIPLLVARSRPARRTKKLCPLWGICTLSSSSNPSIIISSWQLQHSSLSPCTMYGSRVYQGVVVIKFARGTREKL